MFKTIQCPFCVVIWSSPLFPTYFSFYTLMKVSLFLPLCLWSWHFIYLEHPFSPLHPQKYHRVFQVHTKFFSSTKFSQNSQWEVFWLPDPVTFCVSVPDPFLPTCYLLTSRIFPSRLTAPTTLYLKVELFAQLKSWRQAVSSLFVRRAEPCQGPEWK